MRSLLLAPLVVACLLITADASATNVETITDDFIHDVTNQIFETPESIQVDRHGNVYVSLSRPAEIRKISPDGMQSTLARLYPNMPSPRTAGLALDHQSNVYIIASPDVAATREIWKILPDGQQSLLTTLPETAARPNGMAYHDGWLYVADSALARLWRVHVDGQSPAEIWSADALLQHPVNPPPGIPGPNGLQVFAHEVYVSVSTREHIVALPINADGSAGPGRVHALVSVDDFAFDKNGTLYAMGNRNHLVMSITADGIIDILLTFDDGLDNPTSAAFGVKNHKKDLYIANGALPIFTGQNPRRPSVMRLDIGIKGEPRP